MVQNNFVSIFILTLIVLTAACISPPRPEQSSDQVPPVNTTPEGSRLSGNLTVYFFDVGTGDSELIQTPSGRTMLIDAGDPDNGEFVADNLKNMGINTLDVVVASSPGNNKIGGMPWILSNFSVGDFLESGDTHNPTPYYIPLLALIQ